MELNTSKQPVTINDVAFEGGLEQSVESDVLLPDYCPDIVKILRCFCHSHISSAQASSDKITVDLTCLLRIYYLGADKTIRCMEQKLPYTKSGDLKTTALNPVVEATARADYVNCRAVNQRRLEVRCAVTISCRIFSRSNTEIIVGATGGGIQLKTEEVEITEIAADTNRQFNLHEDLQLAGSKPSVRSMIRQECCCKLSDYKVIAGKVILKGELVVRVLYQPEAEGTRPEIMEYALPVSQIVDVDGVDEDQSCEVSLGVANVECNPKQDLDGESRLLAMDCVLLAHVRAHRRKKLCLITDCYSTAYECRMERTPVSCLNLLKAVDERHLHKCTIPLPEGTETVLDLFCIATDITSHNEAGAVSVCAKLLVCMFICDAQGNISYAEQAEECTQRIMLDSAPDGICWMPRCTVLSSSYSMAGAQSLDCRCEVAVQGCIYALLHPRTATALSCDSTTPKEHGADAALIIYYAAAAEDVWEIAKRYNTSLDAIMSENGLESTTLLDKRMLLIPIV